MTTVKAKDIIGTEQDPTSDATTLAKHIIHARLPIEGLTIDVSDLAPEDLVSSFVNALLYALEEASMVQRGKFDNLFGWKTRFPSEKKRLDTLVALYMRAAS